MPYLIKLCHQHPTCTLNVGVLLVSTYLSPPHSAAKFLNQPAQETTYSVSFFIWGLFTGRQLGSCLYLWTPWPRNCQWISSCCVTYNGDSNWLGDIPFVSVSSSFEVFIAITVIPGEENMEQQNRQEFRIIKSTLLVLSPLEYRFRLINERCALK